MATKRQDAFDNDGMQHYYSTCPECRGVVSDENIVFVDGRKRCRECLKKLASPAEKEIK